MCTKLSLLTCLLAMGMMGSVWGQSPAMPDSLSVQLDMLARFYREKPSGLFWFAPGSGAGDLRRALRAAIDSAEADGLAPGTYIPGVLAFGDSMASTTDDSERIKDWDRTYTGAALALGWDLFRGGNADSAVSYDGVSGRYAVRDEQEVAGGLARVRSADDFRRWVAALLPSSPEYRLLKDSLAMYRRLEIAERQARLGQALNSYRWVHHFPFYRMIVVNIPAAELRYYAADTLNLLMRIVAGMPSRRTPRFAGWCDGLVLYPYWNVPQKIAARELVPLFRLAPDVARQMELQVLDDRGKVMDPEKISWASFTQEHFPYRIRQAPGCLNALGVIKFNLTDPYDVYMHDTNLKKIFSSSYRYYSHGCIRLERPIALGKALLPAGLDTAYLLSCYRDQRPVPVPLAKPVPVFVLYNTVGLDGAGGLAWYKDVYKLGK